MTPAGREIWIMGTDTGVGKTLVTAALVRILRDRGYDALPMKPVETGCTPARIAAGATDLAFCLDHARVARTAAREAALAPLRFALGASPHLAAAVEEGRVDVALLRDQIAAASMDCDMLIVEGVGGLLVPLTERALLIDLPGPGHAGVVLVGRAGLGTLNHVLLSLEALHARGLACLGVVLNRTVADDDDTIVGDNRATLAQRLDGAPVVVLPHLPQAPDGLHGWESALEPIAAAVLQHAGGRSG